MLKKSIALFIILSCVSNSYSQENNVIIVPKYNGNKSHTYGLMIEGAAHNVLTGMGSIIKRPIKAFTGKTLRRFIEDSQSRTLKDINSKCSAWNDISQNQNCDESELCPLDSSIFKATQHQRIPSKENSLSFTNHSSDIPYEEISGFCWGHADLTQKLQNLAIFQPQLSSGLPEGSEDWISFYRKIINDIAINKARIVPEFSNILEFSSHLSFKDYFGKVVARQWSRKSMNLRALHNTAFHVEKRELFLELKSLLKLGLNPLVIRKGDTLKDAHVLIPWHPEGTNKICLNDNNEKSQLNASCTYSLNDRSDLKNYSISYHSLRDLNEQASSLQAVCKQYVRNPDFKVDLQKKEQDVFHRVLTQGFIPQTKLLIENLDKPKSEDLLFSLMFNMNEIDIKTLQDNNIDPLIFIKKLASYKLKTDNYFSVSLFDLGLLPSIELSKEDQLIFIQELMNRDDSKLLFKAITNLHVENIFEYYNLILSIISRENNINKEFLETISRATMDIVVPDFFWWDLNYKVTNSSPYKKQLIADVLGILQKKILSLPLPQEIDVFIDKHRYNF